MRPLLPLTLLALACGEKEPVETGGPDDTADDTASDTGWHGPTDFVHVIYPIMSRVGCPKCHLDDYYSPGFILTDVDTAYSTLMTDEPTYVSETWPAHVVPGDALGSIVYDKISNDVPSYGGARMPYLLEPLPDEDIEAFRVWIDEGAVYE